MTKFLTQEMVNSYYQNGFVWPIRVLAENIASNVRGRLEKIEKEMGGNFSGIYRSKFYLRYLWAYHLATTPAILDAVEDLIGPDILLYHNTTWFKKGGDQSYVTWHQDITYFGHEPPEVLSVWIALTHSTKANGCMQVLPDTHKLGPLPLATPDLSEKNLLPSGQLVDYNINSIEPIDITLKPGEASIHHACTIHGSRPNMSKERRMGITFCFHSPHIKQRGKKRTSALLVRGSDRHGHYEIEKPPTKHESPEAIAEHERAVTLYRAKEKELGKKTVTRFD
tara:strand:+ start:1516 stop:2358 length:843 start_codon:yes stop_codon:yes gene_type:complete